MMIFSRAASLSSFSQRGYSLVEMTVVLLIFALVVAGSWYTAGILKENRQVEQVADMLLSVRQGYLDLYGEQPDGQPDTDITGLLAQSGAIPFNMYNGSTARLPWGQPFVVSQGSTTTCGNSAGVDKDRVSIEVPYIAPAICIKLVRAVFVDNPASGASTTGDGRYISQVHFNTENVLLSAAGNGRTAAEAYQYAQVHCALNSQLTFHYCKP